VSETLVNLKIDAGFAYVELVDSRELNLFSTRFVDELYKSINVLVQTPDLFGAIIFTRSKNFSLGLDLKEFSQAAPESFFQITQNVSAISTAIANLPFPTLAIFNGYTIGGPLEIALSCDFRYALPGTKISIPAVKIGFFNPAGVAFRLPQLIGTARAKELLMFARTIEAEEALDWSLVTKIVPDVQTAINEWVVVIRSLEPHSLKTTKLLIDKSFASDYDSYMELEKREMKKCAFRKEPYELMKRLIKS
jgi:enoyl-CoA hydratase